MRILKTEPNGQGSYVMKMFRLSDNCGKFYGEGKVVMDIQPRILFLPILIFEVWLDSLGKVVPILPMRWYNHRHEKGAVKIPSLLDVQTNFSFSINFSTIVIECLIFFIQQNISNATKDLRFFICKLKISNILVWMATSKNFLAGFSNLTLCTKNLFS